jgi:hypothetical protein
MKVKLFVTLFLLFSATYAFARCGEYLHCPYELFENERRVPFTAYPEQLEDIVYSMEDVNENKFVVCVLNKGADLTIFLSHGCENINYGTAKALVDAPRDAAYWDGTSIKFHDGKEGRGLKKLHRPPGTFEAMEHKRGGR